MAREFPSASRICAQHGLTNEDTHLIMVATTIFGALIVHDRLGKGESARKLQMKYEEHKHQLSPMGKNALIEYFEETVRAFAD